MSRLLLAGTLVMGTLAGCSGGGDALDKAAATSAKTSNAPPDNPNKVISIAPPLAGPNAGKGGTAGDR